MASKLAEEWHQKQSACCQNCTDNCPHKEWELVAFDAGRESLLAENRKLRESLKWTVEELPMIKAEIVGKRGPRCRYCSAPLKVTGHGGNIEHENNCPYVIALELVTQSGHPTPAPGSGEPKLKADAPDMDFI